jgi:hypothetical protein
LRRNLVRDTRKLSCVCGAMVERIAPYCPPDESRDPETTTKRYQKST